MSRRISVASRVLQFLQVIFFGRSHWKEPRQPHCPRLHVCKCKGLLCAEYKPTTEKCYPAIENVCAGHELLERKYFIPPLQFPNRHKLRRVFTISHKTRHTRTSNWRAPLKQRRALPQHCRCVAALRRHFHTKHESGSKELNLSEMTPFLLHFYIIRY